MIKKTTQVPVVTVGTKFYESETGCCPSNATQCEYSLTNAGVPASITAITVTLPSGVDDVWTLGSSDNDDAAALRSFIKSKCNELGYEFSEIDGIEANTKSFEIVGTTLKIVSELVFKSVTISGSPVLFTALCTRTSNCEYEVAFAGGTNPVLSIDGTDYTVTGAFVYPDAGGTAAALQTAIETAVDAILGTSKCISVSVEADADSGESGAYVITINAVFGLAITFDGKYPVNNGCVLDWVE